MRGAGAASREAARFLGASGWALSFAFPIFLLLYVYVYTDDLMLLIY